MGWSAQKDFIVQWYPCTAALGLHGRPTVEEEVKKQRLPVQRIPVNP
jgi:hypothetical protein